MAREIPAIPIAPKKEQKIIPEDITRFAKKALRLGEKLAVPALLIVLIASQRTEATSPDKIAAGLVPDGKDVPSEEQITVPTGIETPLATTGPAESEELGNGANIEKDEGQPNIRIITAESQIPLNPAVTYEVDLPSGTMIEVPGSDWLQTEAETLIDVTTHSLEIVASLFGESNKKIGVIQIVKLSDDLRKGWGWDRSFKASVQCDDNRVVSKTEVQNEKATCTIYIAGGLDSQDEPLALDVIPHEVAHMWIGGVGPNGISEIGGSGYVFRGLDRYVKNVPSGKYPPALIFNEEQLATFAKLWANPKLFGTPYNSSVGGIFAADGPYIRILTVDQQFFIKLRRRLEIIKEAKIQEPLSFEEVVSVVGAVNPETLEILGWR